MSLAPTLTPLPQYPLNTDDPEEFDAEAYTYTVGMDQLVNEELPALIEWMNTSIGFSFAQNYSEATYDLLASELNIYKRFTNSSAKTITVRPNAVHAIPQGSTWTFRNANTSDVTLVEGDGVTINPPAGGTLIFGPGATVSLIRVALDEYDLLGQTVAA